MSKPVGLNKNSFGTRSTLTIDQHSFQYHSLPKLAQASGRNFSHLPFSIQILVENLLRFEDGKVVKKADIESLIGWQAAAEPKDEIQFMPARALLQDFTGVPAVADLAAMRDALKKAGGDPNRINPLQPADLVIDHSVQVDVAGTPTAFEENARLEFERNRERYEFLRWGQSAFKNFRVVPPDTGIVHQVNLEFLAPVAMTGPLPGLHDDGQQWIFPDTLVGTDSHTTMINGLGCLGWGVGGIEAEAAMLGQPCSMLIPQVVGFRMSGKLTAGVTATDLVLTATQMLRKKGVVGKFVEFFGPGLASLTLADRATLANMAPEYGATVGLFPVDAVTTEYLRLTGRKNQAAFVEAYFKAQGWWYDSTKKDATYSDLLDLDLSTVEPSLAGPSRPQDRVSLAETKKKFRAGLPALLGAAGKTLNEAVVQKWAQEPAAARGTAVKGPEESPADPAIQASVLATKAPVSLQGKDIELTHGSVVIAAITSCTNTSNPGVLIAAGLLARNAVKRGLKTKPWVKASLAPGSKVVTDYLTQSGLMKPLEDLSFHLVGYGCTTCIGNSGPLPDPMVQAIQSKELVVAAVLSGNRNFEGRVHANVKANYLASPPLVVAYALAGNVQIDLLNEPLGLDTAGKPVYLDEIWPKDTEVAETIKKFITASQYEKSYADVFRGAPTWQNIAVPKGENYRWDSASTYIKEPPFLQGVIAKPPTVTDIKSARVLALLGDSITTDHISPAGSFGKNSPAGLYLQSLGVKPADFNSYGARRGNHEVMVRGTFANIRLKNLLVPGIEGGITVHLPTSKQMSIFDAAMQYAADLTPTIVIAGKEYGTGSSRDWAAKGPKLLGIRAVIAESFERIHRSNLIGMGILPLQFLPGESAAQLQLTGSETYNIVGLAELQAGGTVDVEVIDSLKNKQFKFKSRVRIDTPNELEYFKHGGILPYVLRQQLNQRE